VFEWLGAGHRAALALLDGRLDDVEALASNARELALVKRAGVPTFKNQLFSLRFEQGRLVELREVGASTRSVSASGRPCGTRSWAS
jgi:hypothetical protein